MHRGRAPDVLATLFGTALFAFRCALREKKLSLYLGRVIRHWWRGLVLSMFSAFELTEGRHREPLNRLSKARVFSRAWWQIPNCG